MIKGSYEAHLPVSNFERFMEFYEKLGLKIYNKYPKVAFFGLKKRKACLVCGKDQK